MDLLVLQTNDYNTSKNPRTPNRIEEESDIEAEEMGTDLGYDENYTQDSGRRSPDVLSSQVISLESSPEKSPVKPLSSKVENERRRCDEEREEEVQPPKPEAKVENVEEEEKADVEMKIVDDEEENKDQKDETIKPEEDKTLTTSKDKDSTQKITSPVCDVDEHDDEEEEDKVKSNEDTETVPNIETNNVIVNYEHDKNSPISEDLKKTEENEVILEDEPTNSKWITKRRRISSSCVEKDSKQQNEAPVENPAKKLKSELESIFPKHNKILSEYIEKTSNETVDKIDFHINQLAVEIDTLNDMIKVNEKEFRDMIHLKKMKEEICLRLTRKKQTILLESRKIGEDFRDLINNDITILNDNEHEHEEKKHHQGPALSSTPLHNHKNDSRSYETMDTTNASKSSYTSATNMILQNRANMKSSDLAKEKVNSQKVHSLLVSRNILPKPVSANSQSVNDAMNLSSQMVNGPSTQQQQQQQQHAHQSILNSYLMSSSFQQLGEILNGHGNSSYQNGNHQPVMIGRQGVIKDVKSIIADYRSQHPESVPRRGRRVKQSSISGGQHDGSMKQDGMSRPSSNDSSSHSISNINPSSSVLFSDLLVQLGKMSGQHEKSNPGKLLLPTSGHGINNGSNNNGSYAEVTLHPVAGTTNDQAGSLLHGILTKTYRNKDQAAVNNKNSSSSSSNFANNFTTNSTLARLLTGPERITNSTSGGVAGGIPDYNISKVVGNNSEITITPVMNASGAAALHHHQQQLQHLHLKELFTKANNERLKIEPFMNLDDEADDSVDRLVIDEGAEGMNQHDDHHHHHRMGGGGSHAIDENEVPFCQGCKKNEAQFVCAGCGNQWYCSRDCQVSAWDDHSEVCTG